MANYSRPFHCTCEIAVRINSTGYCKTMHELEKHDKKAAERIQREVNAHAKRLHKECSCIHKRIVMKILHKPAIAKDIQRPERLEMSNEWKIKQIEEIVEGEA